MDTTSEFTAVLQLISMLLADPRTGMLIALLIAAAWSDYGTGRIPNPLVFGGALVGLAYAALVPPIRSTPVEALLMAAAGLGCGLLALLPFYLLRAMGAGDVKLMAMTGAFLGFPDALAAVVASFLAGGALSLAYLASRGELRRAVTNLGALGLLVSSGNAPVLDSRSSAGTMPYGIAIAAGTIGYLLLRQLGVLH